MARALSIRIEATSLPEQLALAASSLRSILDVLEASRGLREAVADAFPSLFERSSSGDLCLIADANELIVCEVVDDPADRANEVRLGCKPSERYLELVAAIGRHRNDNPVFDTHGWPSFAALRAETLAGTDERSSPRGGAE